MSSWHSNQGDTPTIELGAPNAQEQGPLMPGAVVGEYVVELSIGAGGMGTVYRATHQVIGKSAAVKVLHTAADSTHASRLIAEARAVNQIAHKNIVDVFDFGVLPDGRPYVVMELLKGRALDHLLTKGKPMSVVKSLEIMTPVVSALQAAHAQGIVHRDLKPANIFLLEQAPGIETRLQSSVKLLDFGIAKFLDSDSNQGLTTDGLVLGTLAYMAPEIASGKDVSVQADTYSLGVMLYQMLVGSLPFMGQNSLETLYAHVHKAPPTPTEKRVKLPPALEDLLLRMLAKDPRDRPKLQEVHKFCSGYLKGVDSAEYALPQQLGPGENNRQPRGAGRLVWTGVVLIGIILILGLGALILGSGSGATKEALPSEAEEALPALQPPEQDAAAQVDTGAGTDTGTDTEPARPEDMEPEVVFEVEPKATPPTRKTHRKRPSKRKPMKRKSGKGPADDAPIDPLKGLR